MALVHRKSPGGKAQAAARQPRHVVVQILFKQRVVGAHHGYAEPFT